MVLGSTCVQWNAVFGVIKLALTWMSARTPRGLLRGSELLDRAKTALWH